VHCTPYSRALSQEIVIKALERSGGALAHIAEELKKDKQVVLSCFVLMPCLKKQLLLGHDCSVDDCKVDD